MDHVPVATPPTADAPSPYEIGLAERKKLVVPVNEASALLKSASIALEDVARQVHRDDFELTKLAVDRATLQITRIQARGLDQLRARLTDLVDRELCDLCGHRLGYDTEGNRPCTMPGCVRHDYDDIKGF